MKVQVMTQQATGRCHCGAKTCIVPTDSPYEFDWTCSRCRFRGTISWQHASPPPTYMLPQPRLFDVWRATGPSGSRTST